MTIVTNPLINGRPWFSQIPALFSDGTAAAPAMSFLSDPDTGIYSAGANQLGFATGGVVALTLDGSQNGSLVGDLSIGATKAFLFTSRSRIASGADGDIQLINNAANSFTKLQFGGSTASFPAIKRNAAAINFRLADDSADAAITAGTITSSGNVVAAVNGGFVCNGRSLIQSPSDGLLELTNNAATGFTRLQLGGTTSGFPALAVSSTTLRVRLADDSGYAPLQTADITSTQAVLGNAVTTATSVATNDDPTENLYQNRVATTDATVTTLHTITIPASTTVMIEAQVIARRTGGAAGTAEDGAGYSRAATIKNVAGVATLIGAVAAAWTMEDQAAWDCTIDVTGATARVRVTGAINNNVTWHLSALRSYAVST